MRTLYVRIVVMTMFIMVISALIAFVVTNIYYQGYLKPENDKKITSIAEDIVTVYEESSDQSITSYLKSMANLGYQFYLIDQYGNERQFGEPFRVKNLDDHEIDIVLSGDIYHGIANFPWRPFITGFFDNELANTVGVPIKIDDQVKALFVRPDTVKQFGEMRIFLTIMLIFILLFSFILVAISTSFIVNPIKKLTEATRKIAAGNYHIQLNNDRYDEIGRLSRDFTKMSNQLREIEKKRQEFVSSVSHEIQSPLTSIQGFSQALREQNLSEQEQDHYLSIIEDESR